MNRLLTEDQRRRYERDGIVFPVPVLSPEEARQYQSACDDLEERLGGRPRTVEVRQMHLHFRWAFDLATRPRVLDAVEDLLGPDLLVWATELFAKHPHDPAISIGWHRDRPYTGFDAKQMTTAWIALGESAAANGCMRAVPGPSRAGGRQAGTRTDPGVREEEIVDVVLGAGEMSLHDADILHGSGPNRSGQKRVGFVVRFVTPEARPPGDRPPVVLARGRDTLGHFQVVKRPADAAAEGALAGMKASASLHLEAVLENLRRAGR
jgi:hypothetical protein